MKKIQVGFLVSYDYELLKNAIPPIYNDSDAIYLAIDKDRLTWNGSSFHIDDSFFSWIKEFDSQNKIEIYQDIFYIPELSTMECEVRQRKMLANKMGSGNWIIQLDADEYFINFKKFISDIKKYDRYLNPSNRKQIQISAYLINIYKFVGDGFLFVDEPTRCLTATNFPDYKIGRNTRKRIIYTNNIILHETLSRSEKELEIKFKNWGHKNELNNLFLEKWKSATKENYKEIKNVFYIEPEKWKSLSYVAGKDISEISSNFDFKKFLPSKFYIFKKNFGQWFKFLFKK